MEDTKKTPAELVADLMLDPGFVLVPQDRYEELIRGDEDKHRYDMMKGGAADEKGKDNVSQ